MSRVLARYIVNPRGINVPFQAKVRSFSTLNEFASGQAMFTDIMKQTEQKTISNIYIYIQSDSIFSYHLNQSLFYIYTHCISFYLSFVVFVFVIHRKLHWYNIGYVTSKLYDCN